MGLSAVLTSIAWLTASTITALAVLLGMRRAGARPFEALVAGLLAALVAAPVATSWALMLPLRFSIAVIVGCLALSAIGIAVILAARGDTGALLPRPPARVWAAAAIPGAAIVALGSLSLYAAWIKPMWEIDGLLYHGPSIANLLQHGSLFGWDAPSQWIFYPNLTAISSATVAVATNSLTWVDATQVPYLVALALVVWAWGGRGRPSVLAGSLAVIAIATPAALFQARALYVDVAYTSLLVGALWLIGLWITRRSTVFLVLGSLLLGAAASTKAAGATAAIAFLLLIAAVIVLRRRVRGLRTMALAVVSVMVAGAPFYLRNVIEHRNPLYPVQIEFAGVSLPGPANLDFLSTLGPPELLDKPGPVGFGLNLIWSFTRAPAEYIYDTRLGGFGPVSAILLILLASGLIVVGIRALQRDFRPARAVGWPIIGGVMLILLQAQAWNPRYSLPIFALLAVIAAVGLSFGRFPRTIAVQVGIVVLAITGALTASAEDVASQSVRFSKSFERLHPGARGSVSNTNPAYQDQYKWVAGLPCGTRILAASTDMQIGLLNAYSYPMWGDGLCNIVSVARDVRGGAPAGLGGSRPNLTRMTRDADYVVAFEQDRGLVVKTAKQLGGRAVVISDPPDYYGADQVVFRIDAKPGRGPSP